MAARRKLFALSMGLSMALSVWLVAQDARTFGILLAALGVATGLGLAGARRLGAGLVVLAVLNAALVVPELALRAAGFRHVSGVQFGYPTPDEFWELIPDEELFWRLPPGDHPPVNSLGFLGGEPLVPKPEGLWRLVVLGDSCSQQGYPASYPDLLAGELRSRGVPVDLVNLSMSGYSSHQGRALAERWLPPLAPDLVLVWYGWNDHWQAYGATDAGKRGSLRTERLYRRSRLLQGLRWLAVEVGLVAPAQPLQATRVPPDDYRANLTAIVTAVRATGAEVVLATAPTSHRRLGVPDYLVAEGFAPDPDGVLERHLEYGAIAREVAAATGAHLVDLDVDFEREEDPRTSFLPDGIHLTEAGRRIAAGRLAAFLQRRDLVAGRRP